MSEQASKVFNVWQLFADDEHTAADGAYVRAIRARKWILLSSAFLAVVTAGLYNEAEIARLLRVLSLPTDYLFRGLFFGTLYLFLQYIFLIVQMLTVYAGLLEDRLFQKRSAEIATATDEHYRTQADLRGAVLSLARSDSLGAEVAERNLKDLERAAAKWEHELKRLEISDPRLNVTFTILEVAIDAMRIVPPIVVAASAIFVAYNSSLGLSLWQAIAEIGTSASGGSQ